MCCFLLGNGTKIVPLLWAPRIGGLYMATAFDEHPSLLQQSEVILSHRYYLRDTQHNLIEDARGLFQRVSK